jgi:dTDP-4-amino-4,6-dideoxygalactose transaminase
MELIPYNRPCIVGNEFDYMRDAIGKWHIAGDGRYTRRSEALLEEYLGARAILTSSCTHALEMTALLLDLAPGDEVIMPSFTFVSTANAYALRGARPVFVDIRPDTLNIDERLIEAAITPNTKAIVVVHYAGVAVEMDAILAIAARHNLPVIEDNAHGLFASYRGRRLGTLGAMATQSFHETKNVMCGEGGALILNDPSYGERAEILREKGTNRKQFFRGMVDKYTWVDIGSSYLMSDFTAAYLAAQLEAADRIQARRHAIWGAYAEHLAGWAAEAGVSTPTVPADREHPAHIFYLLMPDLDTRTRFIEYLRNRFIVSVFHYLPLHLSPMGMRFGGQPGDCPVTEDISERLVRLPLYYDMTVDDQRRVINAIRGFTV